MMKDNFEQETMLIIKSIEQYKKVFGNTIAIDEYLETNGNYHGIIEYIESLIREEKTSKKAN